MSGCISYMDVYRNPDINNLLTVEPATHPDNMNLVLVGRIGLMLDDHGDVVMTSTQKDLMGKRFGNILYNNIKAWKKWSEANPIVD